MKKVIAYSRVSTEEQSREGISLAMQTAKIRAYCEVNDLELIGICEDAGISAKSISGRPGFQAALDSVYAGEADGLLVWKLDRAFRSTQDALGTAEKLNKRSKALISICEKLDTTTAIGEFFFTLLASLAQMERKLIGERTSAALAQIRASGRKTGGDVPFGFRATETGRLVPDIDEQRAVKRILQLRAENFSLRQIVRCLAQEGITSRSGRALGKTQVERVLRREAA